MPYRVTEQSNELVGVAQDTQESLDGTDPWKGRVVQHAGT